MSSSAKYRRFAQECLEMARTTEDPQSRAVLLQMAQVWARLAGEQQVVKVIRTRNPIRMICPVRRVPLDAPGLLGASTPGPSLSG